MAVNKKLYTDRYFEEAARLAGPSAEAMVKILINNFHPRSVVDIGCGSGLYLKEFFKRGVEILGYDGSPAAIKASPVGDSIIIHDLAEVIKINRRFDLCLCIEVAEHLPKTSADTLIDTLVGLSDIIIFTAATPGQAPVDYGHINEQPPEYWIEKFKSREYKYQKNMTEKIAAEMKKEKVIWWIVNNLMIYNNE